MKNKWLFITVVFFTIFIIKAFLNIAENGNAGMKNLNEMMSLAEEMDKITPKPLRKNNNNKIMPGRYVVERYYEKSAIDLDEQEKIKNLLIQHQWIGGGSLFCKDGIQLSIEDAGIYLNGVPAIYYGFISDINGTKCNK